MNIRQYLCYVQKLKYFHENRPISLGVWGSPPDHGSGALIFEYLKVKKVKIIGAQHGCCYGEMYEPIHIDSDFMRCDYFLSYGFTQDDLKRIYPDV